MVHQTTVTVTVPVATGDSAASTKVCTQAHNLDACVRACMRACVRACDIQ